MSCEFCEKADFGNFSANVDTCCANISLAAGSYRFPKDRQFNFCPMCGEALSEEKPLTLEELLERDGKPVWVRRGDENEGWAFVDDDERQCVMFPFESYITHTLQFFSYAENCGGFIREDEWTDRSWLAYAHKPKEAHHNG